MKIFKKIPLILVTILIIILGITTFIEAKNGSDFVLKNIYHSWWFIAFFVITTILYVLNYVVQKSYKKNIPMLFIHISICVILLGGFVSFLTSERGEIHIRKGEKMQETNIKLPFEVELKNFKMDYYSGTNSPMDFISEIKIIDNNIETEAEISMNNVAKYKGYKFYQSDFDEDMQGSVLMVTFDFFGTIITYIGYLLLLFSTIWIFFSKSGDYRKLLKKTFIVSVFFLFGISSLSAQKTISKENAEEFGKLSVFYNRRIAPIDTYAKEFVTKIYGKSSYKDFDAVQVFAGWIFYPEEWQFEPMIKIKNSEIKSKLNFKDYISFQELFITREKKLDLFSPQNFNQKGLKEIDEKYNSIFQLSTGKPLKIFPYGNKWLSPTDDLSKINSEDTLFMSSILQIIYETLENNDTALTHNIFEKLHNYQIKKAEQGSISDTKTNVEILYNKYDVVKFLFIINLIFAVLAFVLIILKIFKNKQFCYLNILLFIQLIFSFLLLSACLITRWYISGHVPLSGIYETLVFTVWSVLLFSILFFKKYDVIKFAGFLLTGLLLLVTTFGFISPKITPLMPVLNSPWLIIHVTVIMISYSLFAFTLILSILYFILKIFHKTENLVFKQITNLSKILLYPGIALLAAGIFIGAVWANITWGRYWGWDPKEVWALITLLIYCIPLHEKTLPIFQKDKFYHLFMIIAILSVVMTYFGVSFLLSGMHSYAG
ncbi:MAG: cytochrome c biogenesis protein CcsA [Bacteroidales bacterium]|jgi:cytochrome c-type biogenesis protein CcsB|nr:cytochrome c biogenesis protein CcsA [Bacteroidales bacterium]